MDKDYDFGFSVVDPDDLFTKSVEIKQLEDDLARANKLLQSSKIGKDRVIGMIEKFLSKLKDAKLDKNETLSIKWPNKNEAIDRFIQDLKRAAN